MDHIAIVGMSCLFPGAENPDEYWDLLINNDTAVTDITESDIGFPLELLKPKPNQPFGVKYFKSGVIRNFDFDVSQYDNELLTDKYDEFDTLYKRINYVVGESLKDSGYLNNKKVLKKTGLIMGNLTLITEKTKRDYLSCYSEIFDYYIRDLLKNPDFTSPYRFKKNNLDFNISSFIANAPTNFAAKAFGIEGPLLTLDAACASSIYVLQLASYYLNSGMADMILGGALTYNDLLAVLNFFSQLKAVPDNGVSIPFDKKSQGITFGEGCSVFVLKRLKDAVRDEDKIYGIIESIGLSNDGKNKFILAPDSQGQYLSLENAYKPLNLSPDIDYLECHATGTPIGDPVELKTMESFFGSLNTMPLYGGSKANMGHMLTASGMASMMKILLAMKNNIIPATINVNDPIHSPEGKFSDHNLVRHNTEWIKRGENRRAGVNTFGFGGINGHIVLSEFPVKSRKSLPAVQQKKKKSKLVITGMAAQFGSLTSLSDIYDTLIGKKEIFEEIPDNRWFGIDKHDDLLQKVGVDLNDIKYGAYIKGFDFDFLKYKIPPLSDYVMLIDHLLMLKVADEALRDAGYYPGKTGKIAVLICSEINMNIHRSITSLELIPDIMGELKKDKYNLSSDKEEELLKLLSETVKLCDISLESITGILKSLIPNRISSYFKINGPSFLISSNENTVFKSLEIASFFLTYLDIEAVLIGSIDFGGEFENVILRKNYDFEQMSKRKIDNINKPGDGAGAIVIRRKEHALENNDRIYAEISGCSLNSLESINDKNNPSRIIEDTIQNVLDLSNINKSNIDYIELVNQSNRQLTLQEINALKSKYVNNEKKEKYLGSIQNLIGTNCKANGIASIIKSGLMLYYQFLPAGTHIESKEMYDGFSSEYSSQFRLNNYTQNYTAISSSGSDNTYAHLILSNVNENCQNVKNKLSLKPYLLLVSGLNKEEVKLQLKNLIEQLNGKKTVEYIINEFYKQFNKLNTTKKNIITISLIGSSINELKHEANLALTALTESTNIEWNSAAGSYFTLDPIGADAEIAFYYPISSFNYNTKIMEMTKCFPELLLEMSKIINNDFKQTLNNNKMLESMISNPEKLPVFHELTNAKFATNILRDYFSIKPDIAFGSSFGENCMLYAFDCFNHEDSDTKENSYSNYISIITSISENFYNDKYIFDYFNDTHIEWVSYYCNTNVEEITKKIKKEDKIFITVIGSPEDLIIAGNKSDCDRIISETGCFSYPSFDKVFVHTPIAEQFNSTITDSIKKSNISFKSDSGVTIYSSNTGKPMELNKENFAKTCSNNSIQAVNVPDIIQTLYDKGTNIFIDIGGNNIGGQWIKKILNGKKHLTLSINNFNFTFEYTLLSLLGSLISHGISIDLSKLFSNSSFNNPEKVSYLKSVINGANPLKDIMLKPENYELFKKKVKNINSNNMDQNRSNLTENDRFALSSQRKNITAQTNETQIKFHQYHNEYLLTLKHFYAGKLPDFSKPEQSPVLFNLKQIIEMTCGNISSVLGEKYLDIDKRKVRARMPAPPFLFVSKILDMQIQFGVFEKCSMTVEIDIPDNDWYIINDEVGTISILESSQCNILMCAILGLDLEFPHEVHYRVIDSACLFYDYIPKPGSVIIAETVIDNFRFSNSKVLYDFKYTAYINGKLFYEANCSGGLFSKEDLTGSKGVLNASLVNKKKINQNRIEIPDITTKTSFNKREIDLVNNCNFSQVFGSNYNNITKSNILYNQVTCMVDSIINISINSGDSDSLGIVIAEKEIKSDHWAFSAHFINDPVFPANLIMDGIQQLCKYFYCYCGLNNQFPLSHYKFDALCGISMRTTFRGQLFPQNNIIQYKIKVMKFQTNPKFEMIINCDVYLEDKIIIRCTDYGISLLKKEP